MTEKLYYADSHLFSFEAKILSCAAADKTKDPEKLFAVVLDRTAFFPEGGGQAADTGRIGEARVADVQEKDKEIIHYVNQDLTEMIGCSVFCVLDAEQRFRRMQNHSGEHIVSGLVHNAYGYDNVGFHMGETCMTIDFDGELSDQQLREIEFQANAAVYANKAIVTSFPAPEELPDLEYRSKLDLKENVRIVEIEGIDRCACCAPHVSKTGEIGVIKILSSEKHRGGVRVELVCGMDALEDFRRRQTSVTAISNLLSAKRDDVAPAVERLLSERDNLKYALSCMESELVRQIAEKYEAADGNLVVFADLSETASRNLVNLLVEKCTGLAAVFFDSSGSGFRYVIGSRTTDLRAKAKEINIGISGRGGGKPEMIMGSCTADRETIKAFFA